MLRRLLKIIPALLLVGAFAATPALAADLQQIIASGRIRIGVPVDVPPFGSMDAGNKPVGLDVDMAHNIAKALGVKLEIQAITGANRIPYLVTNKLDMVIAAMGATPQRALQIDFSGPYAGLSIGVFGPDNIKVTSPADLGTYSVAVARGTTQDLNLTQLAPHAHIIRFDDDATAAAAFMSGQAQLLATADVVAKQLMERNPKAQLHPKFIMEFSPCYIGVQKGSPELLRWLDTFINVGRIDGSLSALSKKWIGTALPTDVPSL